MHQQSERTGCFSARVPLTLVVFATIGAFFLFTEHRAHVFPFLPWVLLAACPLMHAYMHGRHREGNQASHGGVATPSGSRTAGATPQSGNHGHDGG